MGWRMKSINLSVIVPVYNTENYLEECLDSIFETKIEDMEVIIIDDGSSDDSFSVIQNFQKRYNNIVFLQQQNSGQGAARNRAINVSNGKYIYFMDSDDVIDSMKFKKIFEYMLNDNDLDAVFFEGHSFLDSENMDNNLLEMFNYSRRNNYPGSISGEKMYALMKKNREFFVSPCLYIIKRSILINKDLRFPENIKFEDEVFTTILMLYINKCKCIKSDVFNRRIRPNSTMTNQNLKNNFKYFSVVFETLSLFYQNFKFDDRNANIYYLKNLRNIYVRLIGLYRLIDDVALDNKMKKIKYIAREFNYFDIIGNLATHNYEFYCCLKKLLLKARKYKESINGSE